MATPEKPSLENTFAERYHERRKGNPRAIAMAADVTLALVLLLISIAVWSPTTATKAIAWGLKILVPTAAIFLFLRAFGRET